jgi:hypothetical protein
MAGSRELHRLFGLEPDGLEQLSPGEVEVYIDEAACLVVLKLDSAAGAFELAMEPYAAYQVGFQLIDRALRACRGSWDTSAA